MCSACSMFPPTKSMVRSGLTVFFTENTAYDPSSPYAASKAAADHLAVAWHRTYGLPVIVSNCSNNYGPFHFPEKLIPLTILNALEGKPLPVYGDGSNVRDWLYVEDHARALSLIAANGRSGQTYNVGGRNQRTNLEVVETICSVVDQLRPEGSPHRRLITFVTDRPGHDRRYAIDATKLTSELGWQPRENFESGIAKTVRWFLSNEWWWRPLRKNVYAGERIGLLSEEKRWMRIVVTGTKGQVVQALISAGGESEVIAVGRPSLDLTDSESVRSALMSAEPDVVVNAAAYTAVDRAEGESEHAFAMNAGGAGAVAEAAREMHVPVIQLSTDYVYDGTKTEPYVEADRVAPCNVYGASKLAGEDAVRAATPNHVILRTAWVYSPFGKNFVRTMLQLAQTKAEIRVVADQWGCPTSAREIARAVVSVAQRVRHDLSPSLRGIYHLAGSGETTWADFADTIFCQIERKWKRRPAVRRISTEEFPTPARRPQNSRLNCNKLKRDYGVNIPDWQESLRVCLEEIDGATKP